MVRKFKFSIGYTQLHNKLMLMLSMVTRLVAHQLLLFRLILIVVVVYLFKV